MKNGETAKGILLLKTDDESREIDFELDYLQSLSTQQRFRLMERKSREMRKMLTAHGHRTAYSITKRR